MPRATARTLTSGRYAPFNGWMLFAAALTLLALFSPQARADEKVIRIGYQKYGTLVLLKGKGLLEERLKPLGYRVAWSEFPSGPPLMEALNAGAIDLGSAGEAPPIFAQAASRDLVYVAHEPAAPRGEAILVAADSPIRTVADLRGRTIALNKGSNVHYFLVRALEAAGVPYDAVKLAFLGPADAAAAFARGSVEAWAIWDPYLASGERATGARTLVTGEGLVPNRQFYLSRRPFADAPANRAVLDTTLAAIGTIDAWAKDNTDAVAAELAPSVGIPAPILTVALKRLTYGVTPLDAGTVADQQAVADAFHRLGLLPKPLVVSDAVWKPGT
ncbi:MAG: aliphatic sulfonate ABC transporter substrate-binding protein [Methylobacterium sp.]|uniref:aliphatic sulfonate ABC transporter substrate-binding protein n=2 Tax=unclassified Methylobacterium TaxID=2615210 RepID=UPI0027232A48|nr:aliphatic sulfonate ABC transporter substrate-binding protein [Methylobacterium sp.]MDO9426931.1 aliphatic sulfonate ABC transporter substrate-binding protein [Methylobacterium sp.]